MGWV
jgi:hypothetical protein